MMPTRAEAEKILEEAGQCNFGPWVNHSRITAKCAEKLRNYVKIWIRKRHTY